MQMSAVITDLESVRVKRCQLDPSEGFSFDFLEIALGGISPSNDRHYVSPTLEQPLFSQDFMLSNCLGG